MTHLFLVIRIRSKHLDARLCLTNTIYVLGEWSQYYAQSTRGEPTILQLTKYHQKIGRFRLVAEDGRGEKIADEARLRLSLVHLADERSVDLLMDDFGDTFGQNVDRIFLQLFRLCRRGLFALILFRAAYSPNQIDGALDGVLVRTYEAGGSLRPV